MGLCKCPKKKVTNLFCFEHTVNVCEHCLVSDHPRCVVQSYLRWLQDSDYEPTCRLCGKSLSDESCGDCVRLLCYDIFHWQCLDNYERSLPANTAPAGFTCPTCASSIFPPPNLSSPVANKLIEFLESSNWARRGLGMPLLEESQTFSDKSSTTIQETSQKHYHHHHQNSTQLQHLHPSQYSNVTSNNHLNNNVPTSNFSNDPSYLYARTIEKTEFLTGPPITVKDSDMDKYKRKPPLQMFTRWLSNLTSTHRPKYSNRGRRKIIIGFLVLIALATLVVILKQAGRSSVENDPLLDPMANPNLRVQLD